MKRTVLFFTFLVMTSLVFTTCRKNENPYPRNGGVELFLLSSYKTVGSTNQIDENTIVTSSPPLVTYADFQSYDPTTFTFKISDTAREAIKGLKHSVFGVPFAIKANNELVYSGYFWPSYSSASCSWVVIDPYGIGQNNEVNVKIGYPGLMQGQIIPDKRNDQRILDIFARDNKLH